MDNFEEYFVQGEPNKIEKAKAWNIAIGLQTIDGLKTSPYLIQTAKKNIEGEITIGEVKNIIHQYYENQPQTNPNDRTEEADKVATRITEILNEASFSFSPVAYLEVHKRLFQDVYDFAGTIRKNNISKNEWVLNDESILYGDVHMLMATLEYDFREEKNFNYKGLNHKEIISHLAEFTSALWQNHIFSEGNTRTTAIFLIKYLHKLGFKDIDNTLFAENAWYFRNALVRANYEDLSKGIYKTNEFLIQFLSNLVLKTQYTLKNRHLHIHYNEPINSNIDTINTENEPINAILELIKSNPHITIAKISKDLEISLSTTKRRIKTLQDLGKIKRKGSNKSGTWEIIKP